MTNTLSASDQLTYPQCAVQYSRINEQHKCFLSPSPNISLPEIFSKDQSIFPDFKHDVKRAFPNFEKHYAYQALMVINVVAQMLVNQDNINVATPKSS